MDINRGNEKKPDDNQPPPIAGCSFRTITLWLLLGFLAYALVAMMNRGTDTADITYSELLSLAEGRSVKSVILYTGGLVEGEFRSPQTVDGDEYLKFKSFVPFEDQATIRALLESGVLVEGKPPKVDFFTFLFNLGPILLLLVFWLFIMRNAMGGGKVFSFGKSRARAVGADRPKTTFEDVAGCDEAKLELEEIIEFLREPTKFQRLGGKVPRGVILMGSPGTGKTLLARAVAGEAKVPFYSLSGSDFVEMFVGVGASRVRDLFVQAKTKSPSIIFIDEIDAVGRHRGSGLGGGHDEREQTLNALLVEMDGFESNQAVIVMAATNRPDVLDPALLRPGRFDRRVVVNLPDIKGRRAILGVHTAKKPLASDVELEKIARRTPGFSGADLESLANEAALKAARRGAGMIHQEDFEYAADRILMGVERHTMVMNAEEKELTAYHESGHAIVNIFVPHSDPVHKVTIVPRDRALGLTSFLPRDDRHNYSFEFLLSMLARAMGGRAAELIFLNTRSTGAGNDLMQATDLARRMVCEWGMSPLLGPVVLHDQTGPIFLGRDMTRIKDFSENTARLVDTEVKRLLDEAYQKAHDILENNRDVVAGLAALLLEKETLGAEEIGVLLEELRPGKKYPGLDLEGAEAEGGVSDAEPEQDS
jgi:cell division protease FtsH